MSTTAKQESIVLGSGTLYCAEFSGTLASDISTYKVDDNLLGEISGGGSVEYKPTYYTCKSDSGKVTKTIITDEEATLKCGIMTWNGVTLQKLCATARVSDNSSTHIRTIKIGGIANNDNKKYVFVFAHDNDEDGNLDVVIVGQNQSGFSLAFAKDKETVIDAEIKALGQDADGTLIQLVEYPAGYTATE